MTNLMPFLIDLAVIAVFALIVGFSTYKGIASFAKGLISLICAVIICRVFGGVVGDWLNEKFFGEIFYNKILGILTDTFGDAASSVDAKAFFESIPSFIKGLLGASGADIPAIEDFVSSLGGDLSASLALVAEKIAFPIAAFVSSLVGYIIVFLLALVVAKLLSFLIVKLMELPVLSTINRIGGFLIGLVLAYLTCWIVCSLAYVIVGFAIPDFSFADAYVFSFFAW